MTSSLASQLNKLQERPVNDKKLSQSFLFSNADAKQLSREQVLEICLTGLRTLLQMDNRFHAYLPILFDAKSTRRERRMLNPEEEKSISSHIDNVLVLLSPHLLLTCSHQVFEYLVRVWEVHTYNVSSVLQAFLPYHDHAVFGRAVTLLDLRDTGFEMLKENQLHAAALLGSQLRQLCGESRKALRLVVGTALNAQRLGVVNSAAFALVCGVGSSLATHQDGESIFRSLLPVVHDLMTGHVKDEEERPIRHASDGACRRECLSVSLLLLCAWSHEVQFGPKVFASMLRPLLELIRRADLPLPLTEVLAVLAILCRTQRQSLDDVALSLLIRSMLDLPWREWTPLLPPGMQDLLTRLVQEVIHALRHSSDLGAVPRSVVEFFATATEVLPLRESDVASLLRSIIAAEESVAGSEVCLRAASALERRFSVVFDKVVTGLLSTASSSAERGSQGEGDDLAEKTLWFVQRRLEGNHAEGGAEGEGHTTAAVVVDLRSIVAKKGGDSKTKARRYLPLTMCLLHHLPEVRLAALAQILGNLPLLLDDRLFQTVLHAMRFEKDLSVCLAWQKAGPALLKEKAGGEGEPLLLTALWDMLEQLVQQHPKADTVPVALAFLDATDVLVKANASTAAAVTVSSAKKQVRTKKQKGIDLAEEENGEAASQEAGEEGCASPLALLHIATLAEMFHKSSEGEEIRAACRARLSKCTPLSSNTIDPSSGASSPSSAFGLSGALCGNVALLRALAPAVTDRLSAVCDKALRQLRSNGDRSGFMDSSSSSSAKAVELDLSISAAVAIATADQTLLRRLLAFFAPERVGSYLRLVKEVEAEAASKMLGSGQFTTGRGAKTLVTTALLSRSEAPSLNDVASHVAATVHAVLLQALHTPHQASLAKEALELNDMLGNALPALATAPATLAPLFLQLLATSGNAQWYGPIKKAVMDAPTASALATEEAPTVSQSAPIAALALLMPLFAPDDVDVSLARQVQQNALTLGATSWSAAVRKGGLSAALWAAVKGCTLSMTTVSAMVEVVALSSGAARVKSQPVSPDAAAALCQWMGAQSIPVELIPRLADCFFPTQAPIAANSGSEATRRALANLELFCSSLRPLLPVSLAACKSPLTEAQGGVLRALLRRLTLCAVTPSHLALAAETLEKGYLHIEQSAVPVYLYALEALHASFEAHTVATSSVTIFKAKSKTPSKNNETSASSSFDSHTLATKFAPLLSQLWAKHGADAATFLARCSGAFEGIFMKSIVPQLTSASPSPHQFEDVLKLVQEVLSAFQGTTTEVPTGEATKERENLEATAGRWSPLQATATMLSAASAAALFKALASALQSATTDLSVQNEVLVAVSQLLRLAPSLAFDDDSDEEELTSLFHFVQFVIRTVPLQATLPLLQGSRVEEKNNNNNNTNSGKSAAVVVVKKTGLLSYFQQLCTLPTATEAALDASVPNGSRLLRHLLVKDIVALLAELVAGPSTPQASTTTDEASSNDAAVFAATDLLTIASPLLSLPSLDGGSTQSLLHLPVISLFLQLHRMEEADPAALKFQSAADICLRVIAGFDIAHQIRCVSGLLRLMAAPEDAVSSTKGTLKSAVGAEEADTTGPTAEAEEDAADAERLRGLCDRLVKPNKLINRQEEILSLIARIVKSDAYLEPFLRIQMNHSGEGGSLETTMKDRYQQDCMMLLIASLNLYAHYHNMHETMHRPGKADEDDEEEGDEAESEDVRYVQVLQLLAGNTLACILAAINEPTFVECQRRLLSDRRVVMQQKGLETLLDRLHQSVPTSEFVLSVESVEEQRRAARDPKKKLSADDLLRLRARPLTTKRTATLLPRILTISTAALQDAPKLFAQSEVLSAKQQEHQTLLFSVGQLGVVCVEEIIRIVASGGSQAAEGALAQGLRNAQNTEGALSKLFGNKSKVQEVHGIFDKFLTLIGSTVDAIQAAPSNAYFYTPGPHTAVVPRVASVVTARLHVASALLTASSTIAQVMGIPFMSEHVLDTLERFVAALLSSTSRATAPSGLAVHRIVQEAQRLYRLSALNAMIRALTSTWHMCQPSIPALLAASSHLANVEDPETAPLASQLLSTLRALLEPRLMLEGCCDALISKEKTKAAPLVSITTHSFEVLFGCLEALVSQMSKSDIAGMSVLTSYDEFAAESRNVWVAALHHLASPAALPSLETMQSVYRAYVAFFVKFKATQCTMYFQQIIAWGFSDQKKSGGKTTTPGGNSDEGEEGDRDEAVSKRVVHRWVVALGLYNHILRKLQSLADFTFGIATTPIVHLLASYCSASKPTQKQIQSSVTTALEVALDTVQQMALAQQEAGTTPSFFATTDVFNALMPALIRQVQNTVYLEDGSLSFAQRIDRFVLPAVRAFMKAIGAPKLWSATQSELAKLLRSPSHHVRRATLTVLRGVYQDGGDEMAATMLSEVLPAVVEATEDHHDSVVEEARLFCNELSTITGSDVLHAMS